MGIFDVFAIEIEMLDRVKLRKVGEDRMQNQKDGTEKDREFPSKT